MLSGRAIYSSSSSVSCYAVLLVVAKFLRAVGLFLAYDLLKLVPVVQFLFIVKAGTAIPLLFLQKPFSSGRRLTKQQLFRIFRHAFVGSLIGFLWMFGLTLCGPLRTILLFEHSDIVVIAGFSALFTNAGGGPAKARGAVFFIVAVITLLLFDHDEKLDLMSDHDANHEHIHSTFISHFFYHIVNLVGWSDHKGGVVLLFITLCLNVGYNTAAKKLSVEVGGAKRLHALSTLASAGFLWPWAAFIYLTVESDVQSWMYLLIPLLLVILSVFIVDFYIEAVAVNHLQPQKVALLGLAAISVGALFLSLTWDHPYIAHITTMHKLREVITEDHVLSGGVVFSLMVLLLGTWLLIAPARSAKGSFIGYSASGLPLYSFTGDVLQRTSHSIFLILKNGLRQILEESNSRKIFYFLCINLMFTFVELLYGVWTNSLGLISDGFHMLFDCSALVMGLYAALMTRWKATRIFSYGYDRVEVLSGFINGLFLVVISIFVFAEAVSRLFEPPEIKTDRLLTVSVIGLAVNLVGIFAFSSSHGHSHGGQSQPSHGHSHGGQSHGGQSHGGQSHGGQSHGGHGHSHGGQGHGHSHGGQGQCDQSHSLWADHGHNSPPPSNHGHSHFGHNTNMQGVFLHILADTMGSVGVIISTLIIQHFGWNIADPICSLFIATLILLSVLPLLKETITVLLLRTPKDMEKELVQLLQKVLAVDGVMSYRSPHIWWHTSSKVFGMLHLQVFPDRNEQKIIAQVTALFRDLGINNVSVQVEKESFFHHLSGLGASFEQVVEATQNMHTLAFDEPFSVKSI